MKWRLLIKSLVFTASGLVLLLVGYSAGLLVQFRRDARFAGYCRIYEKRRRASTRRDSASKCSKKGWMQG